MKKIYIVITFIMCLFLLGCSKEEPISINNEDEMLDFVYSGYLDVDRPEYDEKFKDYRYEYIREDVIENLNMFTINRYSNYKMYEAFIYKKKYVAGYISNETINKMVSLYDGSYEYFMNEEKGYSSLYPIYSKLYQEGSLSLEKDKTYIYSFNDGIPLEYDDKKLVFVIEYYEVSLNDDKIITPIIYTKGRVINNYYYCDVPIIYMDYNKYLFQELDECPVISLQDFYYCSTTVYQDFHYTQGEFIIYELTITEEEFDLLSEKEQDLYLECFEMIKPALKNDEFKYGSSYIIRYEIIKDMFFMD